MNVWDGKASIFITKLTNIVLLNIFWILTCLPIITIVPATTAMVGVIRDWKVKGEEQVFHPFLRLFLENLKLGLCVGIPWIIIGGVLVFDFVLFLQMEVWGKLILVTVITLALLLYFITTAFLIPVILHFKASMFSLIKKSFIFSFYELGTSIAILLLTVFAMVIAIYFPITILFIGSLTAMINYRFYMRTFKKFEEF